jgi:nucleotide-binding universal stress UspA family protein
MSRIILCVVDNSPELQAAISYACCLATIRKEEVGLLYVSSPGDFQHFRAVESLLKEERRAEAEQVLRKWAMVIEGMTGARPVTYVREGANAAEELLCLLLDDRDIAHLVLASSG